MTYTRNGVPLELSRTEQRLLRLLAEHRGQTLPRARLLEQVWDGGEFVDENALSVAVNRLRAKLTDAPIRTVYGVGYVWAVEPWRSRFCSSPSSRPRGRPVRPVHWRRARRQADPAGPDAVPGH